MLGPLKETSLGSFLCTLQTHQVTNIRRIERKAILILLYHSGLSNLCFCVITFWQITFVILGIPRPWRFRLIEQRMEEEEMDPLIGSEKSLTFLNEKGKLFVHICFTCHEIMKKTHRKLNFVLILSFKVATCGLRVWCGPYYWCLCEKVSKNFFLKTN